jgi:Putative methyltransferase
MPSGQTQLNIIGCLLLVLLAACTCYELATFTWANSIPLALMAYVAFRIIFELTINRANVPTLATSFIGRGKMAAVLKAEADKNPDAPYTIIDLGSGRGELTRRIAKAIPKATVLGIEMARIPFWQSVWVQRLLGPKNLSYQCIDFWPYDCSKIDAVVFYLSMPVAQRVGAKLFRELKSGSTVISHTFPLLEAWTLVETISFLTPFKEVIYVYRKP